MGERKRRREEDRSHVCAEGGRVATWGRDEGVDARTGGRRRRVHRVSWVRGMTGDRKERG